MKTEEEDWCKLHGGDEAKGGAVIICELEDQPILSDSLRPGADIGEGICRKEDTEISMAESTPISIRIYCSTHYSSSMKQKSTIASVVTLVTIGTICWVAAAVVAIAVGAMAKIIWTCFVGAVLGLIGIRYSIRRNRRDGI